ncbi:MAG: hypothetical protein LBF22_10700 [Deltaproteobacteria bacterium]|nr:hypothetical protein [Deltaproteobacteria bacterium]
MRDPLDSTRDLPKLFFTEWLQVSIPGTTAEATYPLPPEYLDDFYDCVTPQPILFFAKSVLETTARVFELIATPEIDSIRPDEKKFPTLAKQVREWTRLMQVIQIKRVDKKSRLLKHAGAQKCTLSCVWHTHPDWPEWPKVWPERLIKGSKESQQWNRWAQHRKNLDLSLIK